MPFNICEQAKAKDQIPVDEIADQINAVTTSAEKEAARANLRMEYASITQYTIHYSNVHVGLSTLFVTMAGFILYYQIGVEKPSPYFCYLGLGLMVFGVFINWVVTRFMQKGIRQLVQIEYILSSTVNSIGIGTPTSGIQRLVNYFSIWGSKLSREKEWKNAIWEDLSKLYMFLTIVYLIIVAVLLEWMKLG